MPQAEATTEAFSETTPFVVRFAGAGKKAKYFPGHQPKSFDWRVREAKPRPCETLNQVISIG